MIVSLGPRAIGGAVLVAVLGWTGSSTRADNVTLNPLKDNTLYEIEDGSLSNGSGEHIFAGRTAGNLKRRAVIAFDVAANVPAGATITAVNLKMNMSLTIAGVESVELHRLLADWGEGASDASGQEGGGAKAAPGDATWIHTFHDTQLWTNAGGDYEPAASASTAVDQIGGYAWSSRCMAYDVQDWLDHPGSNFGWIVIGAEDFPATAKRFDSRENLNATLRPTLSIEYSTSPVASGAVPDGQTTPGSQMLVAKTAPTTLVISWGISCASTDNDYGLYEGTLGAFYSHHPLLCSTACRTSKAFTPGPGDRYYLVAPRNGHREGSYGRNSSLVERPQGTPLCLTQLLGACP